MTQGKIYFIEMNVIFSGLNRDLCKIKANDLKLFILLELRFLLKLFRFVVL